MSRRSVHKVCSGQQNAVVQAGREALRLEGPVVNAEDHHPNDELRRPLEDNEDEHG